MTARHITWLSPGDPPEAFPPVTAALEEPDGLLAAGGDLTSERLLAAYRRGIFPWYEEGQPILWWSPNPRCVLLPGQLRVSKRLQQYARRSTLTLSYDTRFAEVMRACAGDRSYAAGTWITPAIARAFERLHEEGWAHSVEIRDGDRLVGGLYGLCIGRVFFGESMFSAVDNASKFAMLGLVTEMQKNGLRLLDGQVVSPHLLSLGAKPLARDRFIERLETLCDPPSPYRAFPGEPETVASILQEWRIVALQ